MNYCCTSDEILHHWKRRKEFTPHLRRKRIARIKHGERKKRRMNIFHISTRPAEVEDREEFGHWECDLMMFKKPRKGNLITLVERKTRFSIGIKNENKRARPTALAIIRALSKFNIKSITFDQGSEFSEFELIHNVLGTKVYFCTPGSPHEKGGIENRNGVIRTVFPRSHDIMSTTQEEIDRVVTSINERPMLCLNYQSPKKLFEQELELL